jgi:hypothetical protein
MEYSQKFNIKIELVLDGKPNAYLYDSTDLIQSRIIFKNWYYKLSILKDKHPKNKLFKHCLSSLWGSLTQANKITKTEQQLIDEKIDYDHYGNVDFLIRNQNFNKDGTVYYELINREKPYLHNLARIKSYLTAFARIKIAKIALMKLSSVIRIQTDSISFAVPFNYKSITNLLPEEKTTGLINWKTCNVYGKIVN